MNKTEAMTLLEIGDQTMAVYSKFVQFQNAKYAQARRFRHIDFAEHRRQLSVFVEEAAALIRELKKHTLDRMHLPPENDYFHALGQYLNDFMTTLEKYDAMTELQNSHQGFRAMLVLPRLVRVSRDYQSCINRCYERGDELKLLWAAHKSAQAAS